MAKRYHRSEVNLLSSLGHVELSAACVRANETGFFSLGERVHPASYDGDNTNIDSRQLFFGGRRIDIALQLRDAARVATVSSGQSGSASSVDSGNGSSAD